MPLAPLRTLPSQAKAQHSRTITIGTHPPWPLLASHPHHCASIAYAQHVSHLCDSHHEGRGYVVEKTEAKGERASFSWCQPPTCAGLARKGSCLRGLAASGFKAWSLVRVFLHPGAGVFFCSPCWADLLRAWAWPWALGRACWVLRGGRPLTQAKEKPRNSCGL